LDCYAVALGLYFNDLLTKLILKISWLYALFSKKSIVSLLNDGLLKTADIFRGKKAIEFMDSLE
jgi:hypothetical protein